MTEGDLLRSQTPPRDTTSTDPVRGLLPLETVNWHITSRCNYSCRFCFFTDEAYRLREGIRNHSGLSRAEQSRVLQLLAGVGTRRLTFTGGEPTLLSELAELIVEASSLGMEEMVVTNGTGISETFLRSTGDKLSAVKLSVDSSSDEVEKQLGRGLGHHIETALHAANLCRTFGIPVMLNTVVTSLNWQEDMRGLVGKLKPTRWKVFQFLPVPGQNDSAMKELEISAPQFDAFVRRHEALRPVAESNHEMWESYVMLDPVGRFFQDDSTGHRYSESILKVGVAAAIAEVGWRRDKFVARGARYPSPHHRGTERAGHGP